MKIQTNLKYLILKAKGIDKKFPYIFDNNIEHKSFSNFIINLLKDKYDLKVISGGYIKYNPETKQFSTVGDSISCKVESSHEDIEHFVLAAKGNGDINYYK
tara:strand:- start:246 stop:548 length:303 start_codon:yes stop_codon:yes gene_type:complete